MPHQRGGSGSQFSSLCGSYRGVPPAGGTQRPGRHPCLCRLYIPTHYDSMIGKLIGSAPTGEDAIKRMRRSLKEFIIEGVKTTIPYHIQLMDDEQFQKGEFNTHYLEEFNFNPDSQLKN